MYTGEDNMKFINTRKIKSITKNIKRAIEDFRGSDIQYTLYAGNPRKEDNAIKIQTFRTLKEALNAMAKGDGHYKISQFFIREEVK